MAGKNSMMRKVSLRSIAAHKLRLALTVIAVVLGTAFISGAFMLTNVLANAFDSAVSSAYDGVDAVVSPDPEAEMPGVPVETREAIAAGDNVSAVNVDASTTVVLADASGEAIQTGGAPASLQIWYDAEDAVGQGSEIIDGQVPAGPQETLINASAAENFEIAVGDELIVVDQQDRMTTTISGIYDNPLDTGGALNLAMTEADYLERYSDGTFLPDLTVTAAEGTSPEQLVADLTAAHEGITVEAGADLAAEASEQMELALSFVNYFLLAFGLVALLVGTFLIANTFAMIVAQRTKEFALLRALGAARKQITRSVVFEAVLVGLFGSVLGVVAGVGLVAGITALLDLLGMGLPNTGLGLGPAAVIVPVILGTVVTVVSAWMPARQAGQVQPVEAMRTTESAAGSPLLVRTIIGLVLIGLGAAAALAGVFMEDATTGNRSSLVGLGTIAVIAGFFLAGPALSIPIVPAVGRVIGLPFGAVGKLAATNSRRNPRRTSATAFALTLGIALVTTIGMLGDTMKTSIEDLVEEEYHADFILSGPTNGSFPVPQEARQVVQDTAGAGETATLGMAPIAVAGLGTYGPAGESPTTVVDGNPEAIMKIDVVDGSLDLSDREGVIIDTAVAEMRGWSVGDLVDVASPASPIPMEMEVLGVYEPNFNLGRLAVSQVAADSLAPPEAQQLLLIGLLGDGSVETEQLRSNLEAAVSDYIVVQVMDSEEITGQATQAIDQMLNILYALLALAVIIAILGIVNTLTLNVIERRQEIGMLRAVGGQRRQVRIMITLEAVQIAVFGAVMGILIGLFLGWSFLKVLAEEGLGNISVPMGDLGWMLAGSVVVGVIAAIWPANRAAKTPPLDAITDE